MYRPAEDSALRAPQPLGQGGTAEVCRAYHLRLKRTTAIKYALPDPELSPLEFSRLIGREYDLIGGYRFPGLVRLLEDPAPEFDHLVMEYCDAPTLDRAGRIDNLEFALNIFSALALDLEYLRAVGVIHGDLKPHNVFTPSPETNGRTNRLFFLKLSDFSLGRRVDEAENSRLGLGTIGYMAPETIREKRTSHQSDLFALGVTAYQMFTGQHPFMAIDSDPVKVNGRVCENHPVPPGELRPDLPDEVGAIIMQLLEKDESRRPASAWVVCEALERAGATFPFRALFRPAFLIRDGESFDKILERLVDLSESDTARVTDLTLGKADRLRLLLTGNFIRDRLEYAEGRFHFTGPVLWPERMRRLDLKRFSSSSFAARKYATISAIVGSSQALSQLCPSLKAAAPETSSSLRELLRQFLHPGTIRRISTRLAPLAYRLDRHELASRLHLQAGDIAEAERCAELAVAAMVKENRTPEALSLLLALDRHAHLIGREYDIRYGLKLKGTIQKDAGDLDQAEKTYLRVIELYRDRPVDKLLAETYKFLGDVYRLRQDSNAALQALEKSLAVFRDLGDELEISHTLTNIGNVHWLSGDTHSAFSLYLKAYRIQKRLDARADLASTLHNIGSVYCSRGYLKRGISLFNHSLKFKKQIGHLGEIARTLNNLGYAYQLSGARGKAADVLTESLEINRRIGSRKEILYNLENLVSLRIMSGQLDASQRLIDEGLALTQANNLHAHEGPLYLYQARIAERTGRYSDALRSLEAIDRILGSIGDHSLELLTSVRRASIRHSLGDMPGALSALQQTYENATESRNSIAELECLLLLVRLSNDPGYWHAATRIVDEGALNRERRILGYGRVEYLLEQGETDEAIATVGSLAVDTENSEPDIDRPWMLNVTGSTDLNRQDRRKAAERFDTSSRLAEEIGLIPELITSQTMLGQIAKIDGDFEKAYGAFKRALGLCRQVAGNIDSPDDRALFLSRPVVQSLALEIKALGKELGQKAKADR